MERAPEKIHGTTHDSIALAHLVRECRGRVIDIGAGLLGASIELAVLKPALQIWAVEIQETLVEKARVLLERLSMKEKYRALNSRLKVLKGDIREVAERTEEFFGQISCFDIAISNPPYRKISDSRLSPSLSRRISRSELMLTQVELVEAAYRLLVDKGVFYVIYTKERAEELIENLQAGGFGEIEIQNLRFGREFATRVLVRAVRNGKRDICVLEEIDGIFPVAALY